MISRKSSGSRRAASAVEPTRSQNSTVSCRRSADDIGAADRGEADSAGALDAPMVSATPQSAQNFLPGGFSAPQAVQRTDRGRGVPQSPQNFFPSRLAAPQLGHSMPHPIRLDTGSISQLAPPPQNEASAQSAQARSRASASTVPISDTAAARQLF